MGSSISKSPLERRKTIVRRSQKRSLVQTESQIEKLLKDIKRFKDTEENENFNHFMTKIAQYNRELDRKSKDIVPEVRILHSKCLDMLIQAEKLLQAKLMENIEKASANNEKKAKCNDRKDSQSISDEDQPHLTNMTIDEAAMEYLEKQRDGAISPLSTTSNFNEQDYLSNSSNKRKTVELNSIRIEPLDTSITELEKSPQEKRKSILKNGVKVLPSFNFERTSKHYASVTSTQEVPQDNASIEHVPQQILNGIKHDVVMIEEDISNFVGKQGGVTYNNLKRRLCDNLDQLSQIQDKTDFHYIQVKRYIESCISFLDEKAEANNDDEVFLPETSKTVHGFKITSI